MIKNDTPDLKTFEEITKGEKFSLSYSPEDNRNRRQFDREEGKAANTKQSTDRLAMINVIRTKQQEIARIVRETKNSEHLTAGVFADPSKMDSIEDLKGLLYLVSGEKEKVRVVEEEESNSLLDTMANLLKKCKGVLGRRHCHDGGSLIANRLSGVSLNKGLTDVATTVAMHKLGELATPLMFNNMANIDPELIINPDNPKHRKSPQASVIV